MAAEPDLTVDELLSQATCAILGVKGGDHADSAVGTAWLAKDDGHLLTAGHVVQAQYPDGEVWVQFPDSEPEQATFVIEPKNELEKALDFAVLKVDPPEGRRPLPFTLVARAEGQIHARGYGSNLPNAQSPGDGTLVGNYLRKSKSAAYLFQYNSDTLSVGGFSGAAIYSDAAKAVIGLQVEQSGGRTGFAMPLARIAESWKDVKEAAITPTRGLAVLLLPLAAPDEAREIVRERIMRPVLEKLNLAMYTSELGATGPEDLRQLELADVVIADVTHGDLNVLYELTVAQGVGTPDVVVVNRTESSAATDMFELVELDLDNVEDSQTVVANRLVSIRAFFEAMGEVETPNPLTSFFKAPLTQISAANALAFGYHLNFVDPVASALMNVRAFGDAAGVTVTVNGEPLTNEQLVGITLTTVIPGHLAWANDKFIDEKLAEPGLVTGAVVSDPDWSRPRSMKCLPLKPGEPVRLLDLFPTTMATMSEAVDERLGGGPGAQMQAAWPALERKEIGRFQSKLVQRVRADRLTVKKLRMSDVYLVASSQAVFPGVKFD
jgi:hypothetical protein